MAEKKSGILDFFTSLRLTIFLLIAIALGALLGTVIPQQEAAEALSARMNPTLLAVFRAFQLFDVYHSAWFILLLLLLAVNLVVCSLKRLPSVWRQFRGGIPEDVRPIEELSPDRVVETHSPFVAEAQRLETLLRKRFGTVRRSETARGLVLSGERGGFSRFGVYVVHLGVLLLIAGGIAGAIFGVKGTVEIAEGETASELRLRGGQASQTLPFSIRCDRFTVEHYEGGAPKLFQSDLTFLEKGRVVRQGALRVNHPIAHGGLRFYQASYGVLPGGRMVLSYARGEKAAGDREVNVGEGFDLPGGEGRVEVLRSEGNLMRMGPAVKLSVSSGGREAQFWVFQNIAQIREANPGLLQEVPLMNPGLFAPWLFALEKRGEKYFTVLQAARDPGIPLVAGGGILLVAGLMVTFFFSHRRFRIILEEKKGGSRIGLAGSSNRDPVGLEKEMQQLLAEIGQSGVDS